MKKHKTLSIYPKGSQVNQMELSSRVDPVSNYCLKLKQN